MTCTFFGHRDAPNEIKEVLKETIIDLIENKNVDMFYVGNHGVFDSMVTNVLKGLTLKYQNIEYKTVLAYLPTEKNEFDYTDYSCTVYPEGIEKTPKRFAISYRNKWMINNSDFVITYVNRIVGGAAQFKELAEKKGKAVINIAE